MKLSREDVEGAVNEVIYLGYDYFRSHEEDYYFEQEMGRDISEECWQGTEDMRKVFEEKFESLVNFIMTLQGQSEENT